MQGLEEKIKQFCQKKEEIIFVYLFGSYSAAKQNSRSDLDLAIYFKKPDKISLTELNYELSKLLNIDKIDIVVLNKASIIMQFRIIQRGKLIYCKDDITRIRYEAKIMSFYYDRQYYYNRHIKENLKRIAQQGLE